MGTDLEAQLPHLPWCEVPKTFSHNDTARAEVLYIKSNAAARLLKKQFSNRVMVSEVCGKQAKHFITCLVRANKNMNFYLSCESDRCRSEKSGLRIMHCTEGK